MAAVYPAVFPGALFPDVTLAAGSGNPGSGFSPTPRNKLLGNSMLLRMARDLLNSPPREGFVVKLRLRTKARREHGMTLIEVLVALAILLFVALAIVELFTMGYLVNMGSLARTDLQYRCQRAAEGIRYLYSIAKYAKKYGGTVPAIVGTCGFDFDNPPTGEVTIPNDPLDPCWGQFLRVVDADAASARYDLRYEFTDEGQLWLVTVRAYPRETGVRYLGMAITAKGVRYVAQLPK